MSWPPGDDVNTVFFKVAGKIYCLMQGDEREDFALVDVETDRIIAGGSWEKLAGAVARLVSPLN